MMALRLTKDEFETIKDRNRVAIARVKGEKILSVRETKKQRAKPGRQEEDLQILCVKYFDLQHPDLSPLLFAIPNSLAFVGKDRGAWFGKMKRLKAAGLREGVLDLFLAEPRGGYHGLFLELKIGRNVMSQAQVRFKKMVEDRGYAAHEIRTFENFAHAMNWYLGL